MNIRSSLIAVIVFCLCSSLAYAEPVVMQGNGGRVVEAITFRNVPPSAVMWGLGLFTLDDLVSGNTKVWEADKASRSGEPSAKAQPAAATTVAASGLNPIMSGIDMVVPCDSDNVLLVYGDESAVAGFKAMSPLLDVVPKQVQVKIEIIELGSDSSKALDLEKLTADSFDKSQASELRQSLRNAHAKFLSSPIISSISMVPGALSTSCGQCSCKFFEIAKVEADNSIALTFRPCISGTKPDHVQELYTQRRIADGDSTLIGGFKCDDPNRELLLLLTATIVK